MSNDLKEKKAVFEGGATRSEKMERYDLIPPEFDTVLSRRAGLGAVKHGEGNWKKGGVKFIKETINHLRAHLASLMADETEGACDDDCGALAWNIMALVWFKVRKPKEFWTALKELREGKFEAK